MVTYQGVTLNNVLESEKFWIVPVMTPDETPTPLYHVCFPLKTSLASLTPQEKSSLLSQLTSQGLIVTDSTQFDGIYGHTRTVLTFPPTRIRIEHTQECR